jgi:hypothetical protein
MASGTRLEAHAELTARSDQINLPHLPPSLRRRISDIGQQAFRCSFALSEQHEARFVFCSRYGELDRTTRILESLSDGEPVSPTDFSLSVHNGLAGLLSIAWKNTAGHTAISAGSESFGYGLLEAVTYVHRGTEDAVLLLYFDDPRASPYEGADFREPGMALSMLLKPPSNDGRDFALGLERRGSPGPSATTAQPLDFLEFIANGEHERIWSGERHLWRWQRCD